MIFPQRADLGLAEGLGCQGLPMCVFGWGWMMGKGPFELTGEKFNYKELFLVRLIAFVWVSR